MRGTFKYVPQSRLKVPAQIGRHMFSQQRRLPCDLNWRANPIKSLKRTLLPVEPTLCWWNLFFYFNGEEGLRRSQMDSMDGDTCGRRWSGHGHSQITISKSFRFIFKVKIRHHISLHEVWQSPCRFAVPLDRRSNYNIQIIKTIKIWAFMFAKNVFFFHFFNRN